MVFLMKIRQIPHQCVFNMNSWRSSISVKSCIQVSLKKPRALHLLASGNNKKLLSQNIKSFAAPIQQKWHLDQSEPSPWSYEITRTFIYRKIFKKKSPSQLQKADDIDSHYSLVYEGDSGSYALWGLGFVEIVGLSCILALPLIPFSLSVSSEFSEFFSEIYEIVIFTTVNVALCSLIARTSLCYALRIYYSDLEDQFIIVFMGYHPFAIKKVTVKPGEVTPVTPSSFKQACIPWANKIYTSSLKRMILQEESFTAPVYYNMLLGY